MEVIFLGTGTSLGVPMIAHQWPGLDLRNPHNWRGRSALHVRMGESSIQVDAGQEFRLQCLRHDLQAIDTFILTHEHSDHMLGMDDLRRFCTLRGGSALPVYSTPAGLARVQTVYPYAVRESAAGDFYAAFRLLPMPKVLEVPGGRIYSTPLPHGETTTLGLVFEETATGARFAYFIDCKSVPPEARALAAGCHAVALDALQPFPHRAHMSLDEALAAAADLALPQTWLTHLTFLLDEGEWAPRLPAGVRLAWDGLTLELDGHTSRLLPSPQPVS